MRSARFHIRRTLPTRRPRWVVQTPCDSRNSVRVDQRDAGFGAERAEGHALFEVQADTVGVVADVPDGEVLSAREPEVTATQADHDRAVDARGPDNRTAENETDVLEHGVAAVLRRLDDARVTPGPERDGERTADTSGLECRRRPGQR